MSDRHLCKAKDKDDGRWYEGYYLLLHDTTYCCLPSDNTAEAKRLEEENTHHYIVFEQMTDWGLPNKHLRAEILPETLCQCTGLKDKNGTLLWENDIVRQFADCDESGKNLYFYYQIKWNKEYCAFEGYEIYTKETVLFPDLEDIEVIGNFFDNPELLEAVQNDTN